MTPKRANKIRQKRDSVRTKKEQLWEIQKIVNILCHVAETVRFQFKSVN